MNINKQIAAYVFPHLYDSTFIYNSNKDSFYKYSEVFNTFFQLEAFEHSIGNIISLLDELEFYYYIRSTKHHYKIYISKHNKYVQILTKTKNIELSKLLCLALIKYYKIDWSK